MLNLTQHTPDIIRALRTHYPDILVIASGGTADESIRQTIEAGTNAISWPPPSTKEIISEVMRDYREGKNAHGSEAEG